MDRGNSLVAFFRQALLLVILGSRRYYVWMFSLLSVMVIGLMAYIYQMEHGLIVTGMNDHVSWGLYISNFTFLVGMAAAAVMLVLPTYILHDLDFREAVLIGEGVAVSALLMCLAFVTVDMGSPERLWHMIPKIGYFNWPQSMLAWDVIVLNGYLALNIGIPFYILFKKFNGQIPDKRKYLPFVFLSVLWAFGIHLVTAFLYAGLPARPFWNSALLGPRFLASAFAAGPAFIIVLLTLIRRLTTYPLKNAVFDKLALIMTVAAQINLVMLLSELFKEFYYPSEHSNSAKYLFFGLHGHDRLVPWIWTAILINIACTAASSIHQLRNHPTYRVLICSSLFLAIWIEKGMGLIVPGFIPSPLGEIVEYSPTAIEIAITTGIWAMGFFILTALIKVGIPIEMGLCRRPHLKE
jgi:molybdopterin-containing oxidoreductase family membrane subunit